MTNHNTIQPHIFPPTWVFSVSASEKWNSFFFRVTWIRAKRGITAACVLAMKTISFVISKSDKPNPEGYPCPSRPWRRSMCYLWPSASARETNYTYYLLIWYPTQEKTGQKLHFFSVCALRHMNAILLFFVLSSLLCRSFSVSQQVLTQRGPLWEWLKINMFGLLYAAKKISSCSSFWKLQDDVELTFTF